MCTEILTGVNGGGGYWRIVLHVTDGETLDAALVVNRHSRIRVGKHMTWNSDDVVAPKMLTEPTGHQRISLFIEW